MKTLSRGRKLACVLEQTRIFVLRLENSECLACDDICFHFTDDGMSVEMEWYHTTRDLVILTIDFHYLVVDGVEGSVAYAYWNGLHEEIETDNDGVSLPVLKEERGYYQLGDKDTDLPRVLAEFALRRKGMVVTLVGTEEI